MFFKKNKSNDFKLKTEEDEDYFKYEDEDEDYFKLDNEVEQENVASTTDSSFKYKAQSISQDNYDYDDTNDEVLNSYMEDSNYVDEDIDEDIESKTKTGRKVPSSLLSRIVNVLLVIVILISFMVLFDVIMLTRFDKGPFFAIKTRTYKDGGTKVYYGLGYKVIKYNQIDGRRDMVVGDYSITYSTAFYETSVVDLAIKFRDDYDNSTKLVGKYMSIKGTVSSVDKKNKMIKLIYKDSGSKYQTTLICKMDNDFETYDKIKKGSNIEIVGTLVDYEVSDTIKLYVNNCFTK